MSHAAPKPIHTHCQNCGTELSGPYCRICGQKDIDFHQSFGHVLHEIIETWLHLDHSFFHGVYNILFRLGKTTKEFNAGQRARHVPPFRFYLVISLLFFFLILPGHDQLVKLEEIKKQAESLTREAEERARRSSEQTDSVATPSVSRPKGNSNIDLNAESHLASSPQSDPVTQKKVGGEDHKFPRSKVQEAIEHKLEHPVETASSLLHGLPKALLACLPFFALITRVLYRKSGYVYIQHLILAFNLHSFVFLWWSTTLGWSKITELFAPSLVGWLIFAAVLFTFWTYYKALKDVFACSWKATIVLGTITGMLYSLLLLTAISTAAALVVFF